MTTAQVAKWWRTAPNPPCRPWCTLQHAEDEFTHGGGMSCSQVIEETDWFGVEVMQFTGAPSDDSVPGVVECDPPTVHEWSRRESSECTLDELEQYARAVLRGFEVARSLGVAE